MKQGQRTNSNPGLLMELSSLVLFHEITIDIMCNVKKNPKKWQSAKNHQLLNELIHQNTAENASSFCAPHILMKHPVLLRIFRGILSQLYLQKRFLW